MRLAVIIPRYGPNVIGGAESQGRGFARAASYRGWDVEIWTSCARSHYTWENEFPPCRERDDRVIVRRFPIDHWQPEAVGPLDQRLQREGRLLLDDEIRWLEAGAHSMSLYEHVQRWSPEFDVVLCLPYASPLVQAAAWLVRGASLILWPCLHDEPYAYMEIVRHLLEAADGIMFLSPEERDLAMRRIGYDLPHFGVVGGGIHTTDFSDQPGSGIVNRHGLRILYVGRLERGKNLGLLYSCMQEYHRIRPDSRLQVIGKGPLQPPDGPGFEYLGFVSEKRKAELLASATVLCQPSLNESFSMTVMESWLHHTPVLVHSDCPVTRGHVKRSRGGLHFRDPAEFVEALDWFTEHPGLAKKMARNGQRYVVSNFSWQAVVSRFETLLERWGLQ